MGKPFFVQLCLRMLWDKKNFQAKNLEVFQMVGVAELESATPCVSCKKCFLTFNKL